MIFLGGFFTILTNVVDGIHQTDIKLVEVSRSMETPFLKHVFFMVIPGAAPNIFTGLRTGLSSCWMCVVAAELVSSTTGLGYLIMNARQFGKIDVSNGEVVEVKDYSQKTNKINPSKRKNFRKEKQPKPNQAWMKK